MRKLPHSCNVYMSECGCCLCVSINTAGYIKKKEKQIIMCSRNIPNNGAIILLFVRFAAGLFVSGRDWRNYFSALLQAETRNKVWESLRPAAPVMSGVG